MPRHRDFIEKTLGSLAGSMAYAARAEATGEASGALQRIDPRVKLAGMLLLILAVAASCRLPVTAGVLGFGAALTWACGGAVMAAVTRLWGGVLLFMGAILLPALFTTPGLPLVRLPGLGWAVTDHGFFSAVHLLLRTEATATLAALMVLTTPWVQLLKALRVLRVPAVLVVILNMTHRYIFVLLRVAHDFFEARLVRRVGALTGRQRRAMAASSAGALLSKSVQLSAEVYEAMRARGFAGNVATLDEFQMKPLDWWMLGAFFTMAGMVFWLGRL